MSDDKSDNISSPSPPLRAPVGTIGDAEMRSLCERGTLIESNFDPRNIKQACYELRASTTYYELHNVSTKKSVGNDEFILIKPRQFIVLITEESLNLPHDVLARVLTKGKLFSVGLLPVNTYADPGFKGNLGIVMFNGSNNYIRIPKLEPIAKVEFSRLSNPVEEAYRGQHGHQTGVWPFASEMVLTDDEVSRHPGISSPDVEMALSHGPAFGSLVRETHVLGRRLMFTMSLYFLASFALLAVARGTDYSAELAGIVLGVASNILFSLFSWFGTKLTHGRKNESK